MDKTQFAGLTRLDPGDPLSLDNSSFQARNPALTDRLLQIGVVTHRHDAHARFPNPTSAPSASAVSSGGTIPADLTLTVGYTLNDSEGGETEVAPAVVVSTLPAWNPPDAVLTGEIDYTGGALLAATYHYAITWTDGGGGETAPGSYVSVEREPGYASGRVNLSGLNDGMVAAGASAWRLYRATGGDDFSYLASGTAATYTDDGTVNADCGQHPPDDENSTTNNSNSLRVLVPSGGVLGSAASFNVYVSPDGDFSGGTLVGTYPISSAGTYITYSSLALGPQSPPDVSTCVPGASKIDPDTDLLDWHWKRPVAASGVLPSGSQGDVRVALDTGKLWGVLASAGAAVAGDWTDLLQTVAGGIAVQKVGDSLISGRDKLRFQASGGVTLAVSDDGSGQATVTVFASGSPGGGGGGGGSIGVGDPLISPASYLRFTGSADTGVNVSDLGGGSAQVQIAAPILTASGGSNLISPVHHLEFAGSGGAIVGLSDLGNASARVIVSASGIQGPPGAAGATGAQGPAGSAYIDVAGSAGVGLISPVSHLRFAASGGASVAVQNIGGGSAQVLVSASGGGGGGGATSYPSCEVTLSSYQRLRPDTYSGTHAIQLGLDSFTSSNVGDGDFSLSSNTLVLPSPGVWTLGMIARFTDTYPGPHYQPSGMIAAQIQAYVPASSQFQVVAHHDQLRQTLEDSDGGGAYSYNNSDYASQSHEIITLERTVRIATSGASDARKVRFFVACAKVGTGGYIDIDSPGGVKNFWAVKLGS